MASFTLVVLVIAGAGALGYFDADAEPPRQAVRAPTATPGPIPTPGTFAVPDPITLTFVLVSTEEHQAVLDAIESGFVWREILQSGTIDVLLVRNPAEEAEAMRKIEAAREVSERSGFVVVVQDLRD